MSELKPCPFCGVQLTEDGWHREDNSDSECILAGLEIGTMADNWQLWWNTRADADKLAKVRLLLDEIQSANQAPLPGDYKSRALRLQDTLFNIESELTQILEQQS